MKKVCKNLFLTLFVLLFTGVAAAGSYLYLFESSLKGNYYFRIASDLDERNPYGSFEAVKYYKKAIKSYDAVGNKGGLVESYIRLGLLHYKFGNMLQVERMVLMAMELGKDDIPEELQAKIYLLLASTLEPEKAKIYIDKSMELSQKLHLKPLMTEAYFLLGVTNEYKANFEEAEANYLKAIDVVNSFSSTDVFINTTKLYENLAELYAGGGEIDKAIQYYYKALDYNLREERGFVTANYMKIIGDLYEEKNNHVKACELWEQSKEEYAFFGAVAPFSVSNSTKSDSCNNLG